MTPLEKLAAAWLARGNWATQDADICTDDPDMSRISSARAAAVKQCRKELLDVMQHGNDALTLVDP